jgi:IS605 OrfB family transposase
MTTTQRTFVSSEARVRDKERFGPLLRAYGEVFGTALRWSYMELVVHGAKRQTVRSSLITSGWREDEADSIIDTALASQEAAVESTTLALTRAKEDLDQVQRKLEWAMAGDSPKRLRQRHGLGRRRDLLTARVAKLEKRLAHGDVRVCFGGRKLAVAGNDPVAHGYASHDAWQEAWQRARSGVIYVKGDTEASFGNSCAKVILAEDGSHLLRLRIPDLTTTHGVRLRDLSGGQEWVEIPLDGFVHGRRELLAALRPVESSAEARARWQTDREFWPAVEPWRAEAEVLAKALESVTGKLPRWATFLPKPPPTTPYKARRASRPISVRLVWREKKQAWYAMASVEPVQELERMYPGRALRRRCARVLGVDLNPDHVAWCVVSTDGNPLAWGKVTLDLTGSAAQNADSIGRAVAKLISVARTHGAVIAHEELDFTRSRANLRYGCSRRLARLLSSFAYHKFFATLSSRARREQVAVVSVNPAWTSVLGQANYAGVYGVSVDQGAACVVARRALGLRTRVRPYVAHVLSRERGTGHTSSGQPGLKLVAKALPKRRSTWEPSGLCLRRHSAQLPGSQSGAEPHGVRVATRTGDYPGLGSQPAPTVARGHLESQARQSHAVVPLPPRPVLRTQRDRHDPGDQHWSAMTNVDLSGE